VTVVPAPTTTAVALAIVTAATTRLTMALAAAVVLLVVEMVPVLVVAMPFVMLATAAVRPAVITPFLTVMVAAAVGPVVPIALAEGVFPTVASPRPPAAPGATRRHRHGHWPHKRGRLFDEAEQVFNAFGQGIAQVSQQLAGRVRRWAPSSTLIWPVRISRTHPSHDQSPLSTFHLRVLLVAEPAFLAGRRARGALVAGGRRRSPELTAGGEAIAAPARWCVTISRRK
jgi:hypothetical protein